MLDVFQIYVIDSISPCGTIATGSLSSASSLSSARNECGTISGQCVSGSDVDVDACTSTDQKEITS